MLRALYVYDVSLSLDLRVRRECLMLANVTEYPSVDDRWLGGIVLMQQNSSFHARESCLGIHSAILRFFHMLNG